MNLPLLHMCNHFSDRKGFCFSCLSGVKDHPGSFACRIYPVHDGRGMFNTSMLNDNALALETLGVYIKIKQFVAYCSPTPFKSSEAGHSTRFRVICASSVNQEAVSLVSRVCIHCQQQQQKAFLKIVMTKMPQLTPLFETKILSEAFLGFMLTLVVKHWAP